MKKLIILVVAFGVALMVRTQVSADCSVDITGLSMNLSQRAQVNDYVTFTANGISSCGGDVYYRFDLVPNYGTSDYDPFNGWEMMQDFSTANSCTYGFTQEGSYIVIVWASPTVTIPAAAPLIAGIAVTVATDDQGEEQCVDVAGTWNTTEIVDGSDCGEGTYTEYETYTVTQVGCNVILVTSVGSFRGSVNGSNVSWTGSYPEDGGTTTVNFSGTVSGDSVSGVGQWVWTYGSESCSGTTQVSGTRN